MKQLARLSFASLSLCLAACSTLPPAETDLPSPLPSATATLVPSAAPTSASAAPTSVSTPTPAPSSTSSTAPALVPSPLASDLPLAVSSGKPSQDLSVIQSIGLEIVGKRFLNGEGESTQFKPILKDAQGQTLNPADFPLEWFSSRTQDFSIDSNGKVVALTDFGYTYVTLRVTGTDLEFKQLLSVTAPVGSVSGGRAPTPAPVIPAPTLTNALPIGGIAGSTVIITGTHFNNATAVNFGSTPASAFTLDSDTQITATAPAGTGLRNNISVTTATGTSPNIDAARFSYTTASRTASWPAGQVTSQSPNIPPANTKATNFTSYINFAFNYENFPFTVPVTGNYTLTASTTGVVNTSWILDGLFTPGTPPPMPLSAFIVGVFTNAVSPAAGNFDNIPLEAGKQYTFYTAFNSGGSPADTVTMTFAGPDGVGVIPGLVD